MSGKAIRFLVVALLGCAGVVLSSPPTSAHSGATYYPSWHKWPRYSISSWYIRDNFPTGDARIAVQNAFMAWNNGTGGAQGEPTFDFDGQTNYTGSWGNACLTSFNAVYWRDNSAYSGDGVWLGHTDTCEDPGWIMRFSLVMNQDKPWHFSSSFPPSTSWDLQSFVTHEVGHATGWLGHYSVPSADLCNQSNATYYATMCDYDPQAKGTTKMRTLMTHDLDVITNAYGI